MIIDPFWGDPIEDDDPFNRNNTRNRENTEAITYNCAGYALETFNWYVPIRQDDDVDAYEWGSFDEIERNAMSFEFVSQILADFDDVRLIPSLDCVRKDEYAFAFRVGVDDFHFVKRGRNGQWYEKRGSGSIYRMTEEKVFHSEWEDGRYNGAIFLFAKKRGGLEAYLG